MQPDRPQPFAPGVPQTEKRLKRAVQRCVRCADDFEAIAGVMPLCWNCCREEPMPHLDEREVLVMTRSWQAVLDFRVERERQLKHDRLAGRLHIPAIYRHAQCMDSVRKWIAEPFDPLTLTGATGRGKTYQACAALREICEGSKQRQCILVPAVSLSHADRVDMKRYREALAIVIDDLGAKITPAALSAAFELIDYRIGERLPIIVTTAMDRATLYAIDTKLESRLSSGQWLLLDGPDRRVSAS